MKKIFTLLFFCIAVTLYGQENAVFSHYFASPFLVNPGYAGFDRHEIMLNFKNSWSGFPGAPKAYAFSYDGPLDDRSGIGGQIFNERIASKNVFKIQGNYAYRFQLKRFKVSMGFAGKFQSEKLLGSVSSDPMTQPDDQILSDALSGFKLFDVSFGLYARDDKGIFLGVVFPDMIRARLDQNVIGGKDALKPLQNYVLNLGVMHDLPDYGIVLEPSVMLRKYRTLPPQVDLNFLSSLLEKKIYLGLSYRAGPTSRGIVLLGGQLKFGRLLYSYSHSFQALQDYAGGGHELSLRFDISNALGMDQSPPVLMSDQ